MQNYKEMLLNLFENRTVQTTIEDTYKDLQGKDILIYGAGAFGSIMLSSLREHMIEPFAFLDIRAVDNQFKNGIPVLKPNFACADEFKRSSIVLISIVLKDEDRDKIMSDLLQLGFDNIYDSQALHALKVKCDDSYVGETPDTAYIKAKKSEILKPLDLFADEESKEIYAACIISHMTRNYTISPKTSHEEQYFATDIPFIKGFKRFIDCGAYIGDTFSILAKKKDIDAYAGFEPDFESFLNLSKAIEKSKIESILFPCAVSDKLETNAFILTAGATKTSHEGTTMLQCVSIDDCLKNFPTTFIKMDIEGSEIKALVGAKNTIAKYTPDLAICVYHAINHYWDIVNLIDSWNLAYKFYLRTYSSACMETVLYAVSLRGDD